MVNVSKTHTMKLYDTALMTFSVNADEYGRLGVHVHDVGFAPR